MQREDSKKHFLQTVSSKQENEKLNSLLIKLDQYDTTNSESIWIIDYIDEKGFIDVSMIEENF